MSGYFAVAPRFEADAAGIVPVAQGRFVLTRQPGGELALDTVISIAPDADSVNLALTVPVLHADETFLLTITLIGPPPESDTVFRAGPIEVHPSTSGAPTPVNAPFIYSGVGSNAVAVAMEVPTASILAGDTVPLTAVALDDAGAPIPGTPVAWSSLDPAVAAVPALEVGEVVGMARGTARIVATLLTGPADTGTVSVTLPPATLVADSGSGQTGPAGALLPQALVARVMATDGVGVPGVWIRFAVALGGGTISADSVSSDANGRARVTWTLGDVAGTQTVTATTPALPSASVTFSATSQSTGPGAVTAVAGDNQSALVSTAVTTAPQVRVTDAQSNPVPNVEVVFAVTQGGGTLTGATDTTDANGLASVGSWTLGPTVGLNALTATVAGVTPVQFLALGTSTGGVTSMTLNAGDGQTALGGSPVPIPPSVLLTDTAGAPIAGVEVTFAITAGFGGSLADTTPVSDASGIASVGTWTLGLPGTNTLTASLPGLSDVAFTATATVGQPAEILIVSGNNQSDTAGTTLEGPLVIEVRDSAANPVPSVGVTWNTLDGSVTPPSNNTDASGQAQASWTLSTNKITQTATVIVSGLTPAVFTATAIFPNPSILLSLSGTDRVRVGSSATLDVTLTAPAPVGGVFVGISSDNTAVLDLDPGANGGVSIPEAGTSGQVLVNGIAGGTATLTATATGYVDGVLSVPVSVQVLSMPGTLNVPFGSTASLPLQISTPAPAGGITVTVVSDNTQTVAVQTPTVTIAEGQQTANATVSGVFPGSATLTGTTTDYGSAQTLVSTTANLNIVQSTLTINASFGDPVTIELRSGGALIPAPAPGVAVTMTPRDPTCVAAVSPVTIPEGLVNITSQLSYGGSATFACQTYVVASAADIEPDSVRVTVNAPPAITETAVTVGAGLQESANASLGASNHGGVNVVIKSTNPAVALVSPNYSTPGTDSIVVPVADGSTGVPYYVQGMEGAADTVSFVYSAPGFVPDTVPHTVVQPQLDISGLNQTTTTLTPDDAFSVRVGRGNGANLSVLQEVRAGAAPLTVTVVSDTPSVGQLATATDTAGTVTVEIPALSSTVGGIAFDALSAGVTVVSASASGYVTTTSGGIRAVTVTAPAITETGVIVGAGLQESANATLGASGHGGVNVVIKSTNPAVAQVSPNYSTPGTDSIVVPVADGATGVPYYVQGVEAAADTVSFVYYTVEGLFVPDTVPHTVETPQLDISGLNQTTTTLTPDDAFTVRVGRGNGANLSVLQEVRAGASPLSVTVTSSAPTVGQVTDSIQASGQVTIQIAPLASSSPGSVASGGVAFQPIAAGVTTVSATIPGFVTTTSGGIRDVTVNTPAITVSAVTVGAGLQESRSVTFNAPSPANDTLMIWSSNPSVALVSPDAATAGSDTIFIPLNTGTTAQGYYVQGVEGTTGTVTIFARASGYTQGSNTADIVEPQLDISGLNQSPTAGAADDVFQVRVGIGNGSSLSTLQEARAGGSGFTATVTSSDPAIGPLVTATDTAGTVTVSIPVGANNTSSGVAFRALAAGSTTVSAAITGFLTTTSGGIRLVTVNP